ncbi:hypothetical protein EVG20_g3939 [Dentipellis fragilis]|uniref:Uncharacterized protein n=1 Tax=Dentipellis fragilis TaxID=205917 RepID=A0A4Y9Z292_9AGAM|nr:hypothetical protein EVG20_g3939 [Dentipellis fragilis]
MLQRLLPALLLRPVAPKPDSRRSSSAFISTSSARGTHPPPPPGVSMSSRSPLPINTVDVDMARLLLRCRRRCRGVLFPSRSGQQACILSRTAASPKCCVPEYPARRLRGHTAAAAAAVHRHTRQCTGGHHFTLDSRIVTMSGSAGLTPIDDTDPGVQYSGSWNVKHGFPGAFQNTVHYTKEAGSSVEIVFSGSNLQVFGAANAPGDALNYTLDSQPLSAVPLTKSHGGGHKKGSLPKMQLLIHLPNMSCSQHTLVLQPKQFMIFDEITYSSTCDSPSDSASVTATSLVSVSATMGSSTSTAAALRAATRTKMAPGAIAGVAIGGTLFLIAIVLFLALFTRHRRQRHMKRPSAEYLASLSRTGTEPLPYGSATFGSFAQLPLYPEKQQPGNSGLNTPPAWRDEKRDPEAFGDFSSPNPNLPQYDYEYEHPADPNSKDWIRRPDPAQVAARSDLSQSSGEGRPVDQPRVTVSRSSSNASTSSKFPNPYDGWPIVR